MNFNKGDSVLVFYDGVWEEAIYLGDTGDSFFVHIINSESDMELSKKIYKIKPKQLIDIRCSESWNPSGGKQLNEVDPPAGIDIRSIPVLNDYVEYARHLEYTKWGCFKNEDLMSLLGDLEEMYYNSEHINSGSPKFFYVYRGIHVEEYEMILEKLYIPHYYAFSTSVSMDIANQFMTDTQCCLMRIKVPISERYISINTSQKEVILMPSMLHISSCQNIDNKRMVLDTTYESIPLEAIQRIYEGCVGDTCCPETGGDEGDADEDPSWM